ESTARHSAFLLSAQGGECPTPRRSDDAQTAQVSGDRFAHAAASERRQMAAAEPVDSGLAPVPPESFGVLRRHDPVATASDDEEALARHTRGVNERRVDAEARAQLVVGESTGADVAPHPTALVEAPGEIAQADGWRDRDDEVDVGVARGEER